MKFPNYTLGLLTGFCLAALYLMAPAIIEGFRADPVDAAPPQTNFKVVDTYKGCDIIEWHYGPLAEYRYFLHCNNTRPVYEK